MKFLMKLAGWILVPELMLIGAAIDCYRDWKELIAMFQGCGKDDANEIDFDAEAC